MRIEPKTIILGRESLKPHNKWKSIALLDITHFRRETVELVKNYNIVLFIDDPNKGLKTKIIKNRYGSEMSKNSIDDIKFIDKRFFEQSQEVERWKKMLKDGEIDQKRFDEVYPSVEAQLKYFTELKQKIV